ncbi:hypothetical protein [Streptomyces humi]
MGAQVRRPRHRPGGAAAPRRVGEVAGESGPYTLVDRTAALGIRLPPAALDQLLDQVEQLMTREGRPASDDDLREPAREPG